MEEFLIIQKGFTSVRLSLDNDSPSTPDISEGLSPYDDPATSKRNGGTSSNFRPVSFLVMNSPVASSFHFPSKQAIPARLSFASTSELLEHVTHNWRSNFVTVDLQTEEALQPFITRPFVLVVNVDAPLLVRFQRSVQAEFGTSSLHDFIRDHDSLFYGPHETTVASNVNPPQDITTGWALRGLTQYVHLSVINSFQSKHSLFAHLEELDLTNPERLRPGWDTYFMELASLASLRSNCMKRRVGAILVRKSRILATGYNGTPRGLTNCNEGGCARCNNGSETPDECVCLHAEENALLEAGRERVGDGAVLYCNTCPCLRCTIKIIQTGVKEVVYNLSYKV